MGSWDNTTVTVVVTKHVTCTFKVTSAASICMHHEALVINTFFTYTVHVLSIMVECVYLHAYVHGVQRVKERNVLIIKLYHTYYHSMSSIKCCIWFYKITWQGFKKKIARNSDLWRASNSHPSPFVNRNVGSVPVHVSVIWHPSVSHNIN